MKKTIAASCLFIGLILLLTGALADDTDPITVVQTILNDPQVLFSEDADAMNQNGGASFGNVAVKQRGRNKSYYEFVSDDNGANMAGTQKLTNLGTFRDNAQAVLFKFNSDTPAELSFTLASGALSVSLCFDETGRPTFAYAGDDYLTLYERYRDTSLTVEAGKDYWVLMAFDRYGYYRSLVWAADDAGDVAFCTENIGVWDNDYRGESWTLSIAFGANQTLRLAQYEVLDFAGFTDVDYSTDTGGTQEEPMAVVGETVVDPQVLYADDETSLAQNAARYSGAETKTTDDGLTFITGASQTGFSFLTPLYDVVSLGSRRQNYSQGVLLCFQTSSPTTLEFTLSAADTVYMSFLNDGMPEFGITGMPAVGLKSFEQQTPTGFVLEKDVWYYAMIAVDRESNIRFRIWEKGFELNYACYETKITDWCQTDENRAKFVSQDWTFGVVMGAGAQFTLEDFRVFDFDTIQATAD